MVYLLSEEETQKNQKVSRQTSRHSSTLFCRGHCRYRSCVRDRSLRPVKSEIPDDIYEREG